MNRKEYLQEIEKLKKEISTMRERKNSEYSVKTSTENFTVEAYYFIAGNGDVVFYDKYGNQISYFNNVICVNTVL